MFYFFFDAYQPATIMVSFKGKGWDRLTASNAFVVWIRIPYRDRFFHNLGFKFTDAVLQSLARWYVIRFHMSFFMVLVVVCLHLEHRTLTCIRIPVSPS